MVNVLTLCISLILIESQQSQDHLESRYMTLILYVEYTKFQGSICKLFLFYFSMSFPMPKKSDIIDEVSLI